MKKIALFTLISIVCLAVAVTATFSILAVNSAFVVLKPIAANAPTCTDQGNIAHYINPKNGLLYSDSKGQNELESYEVVIPAVGHICEHHEAKLPTCMQGGNIEYWQCARCGKYYSDAYGNSEISYNEIISEKATEHNYNAISNAGEWIWSIDFLATRFKYFCTTCENLQEVQARISVKEIPAICDDIGFKIYKATVIIDGINYSDEKSIEIPATGHNFAEEFTIDIASTCSKTGIKSKHCSRCNAKSEVTEIPTSEHTVAIDIAVSPDCTHTGLTEGSHCSVCGATIIAQRVLDKLEHDYISITTEPTFTEQGYTNFTCRYCGFSYVGEFVDPLLSYSLLKESGSSYAVSGCNITEKMAVTIPETYKGLPISSIGERAFANNGFISSIFLSKYITTIGNSAFSGCSSLVSANLSKNLTSIGASAFSGCGALKNIKIPESVKTIGYSAFAKCISLTSLQFPINVESIGSSALSGCSSLISITLPFVGGSVKSSTDTYQYPFGYIFGSTSYTGGRATNQTYYTHAPGSGTYSSSTYYIPTSLESVIILSGNILSGAFWNCILKEIVIPSDVKIIEKNAFYGCTALENFTIPTSVERIEEGAFWNCRALKNIIIPDNITYLGEFSFSGCSSLENVVISKNLTSLEDVFSSCTSLKSVEIPDKVTNINTAFFECVSLENIYLHKNIKTMKNAFANIANDEIDRKVYYKGTLADWCDLQFSSKADTPLVYQGHFYLSNSQGSYEEVVNLVIPNSISNIGDYQFFGFSFLESVSMSPNTTVIGNNAFTQCVRLTKIDIPENVSIIGDEAFYQCNSLSQIEIGVGVKRIGKKAFVGCYTWAKVKFKQTRGWWVSKNLAATSGTNIPSSQLANSSQAHDFLSASNYYADYYWKRS